MSDTEAGQPPSYARLLREHAAAHPDEVAYVHLAMDGSETDLTWAELDRRSSQVAAAFDARGVGFGDRVGLGIRNSPELVASVFAAWKLGAVPVPVRWDVPDWELERLQEVVAPTVYVGPVDLVWLRATADDPVPDLPDVVSPHSSGICSSGSTGTPKVILANTPARFDPRRGRPMAAAFKEVPLPQRILVLAPMYHINAFVTLTSMLAGDRLYVLEKFDAARIVDVIERHRITTFTSTPTMVQRIADVPGVDDRDLSSIVWFLIGSAMIPPSLVHRWIDLVGAGQVLLAYGMTETIGTTALMGDEWLAHPGSVGRGFGGAEVRILDDLQHDLPSGEIGHVYLRSPGYRPATYLGTAPQIPMTDDGFGTVGDMGWMDEDGYLYLADRRVDLIITGGANVFPAEVEAALIDHPQVADVVVVGLADAEWGRRVHPIVEPADATDPPTEDQLRDYTKARLLPYKVPKTIELVDAIPRSEAGKVNRGRLVEQRGG